MLTAGGALSEVVWKSLTGPHAHLAERHGDAVRYPPDMSPFGALAPDPSASAWRAMAELIGPGHVVSLAGPIFTPPQGWELVNRIDGVQMVAAGLEVAVDPEAEELGKANVEEMLALIDRTRPGPFLARTVEMGRYIGVRREGRLVAMAGERLHPPGWVEISAVCTDAEYRGQGLGTRLVRTIAAGIRQRGEQVMLHASARNTGAIALYEHLGFEMRDRPCFQLWRAPG